MLSGFPTDTRPMAESSSFLSGEALEKAMRELGEVRGVKEPSEV